MIFDPDIYTQAECTRGCYWEKNCELQLKRQDRKDRVGEPRRKEVRLLTDTKKTSEGSAGREWSETFQKASHFLPHDFTA